jgi:Rieske 2Fe-2S family protein
MAYKRLRHKAMMTIRNPNADAELRADLRRVLEPLEQAKSLPRRAYVDPDITSIESQIFFGSAWLCAAHESELVAPGSFVAVESFGERTVVVRGADLELHAWADRCVHRGTPLTEGSSGRIEQLELACPYHGLRYDLTGRVFSPPKQLSHCAGKTLGKARVSVWNGFVFLCRDPSTPSFETFVGAVPPWFERAAMHALRLERRTVHEVKANWKLLVANFQESHHFPSVHPNLEARTPWLQSASHDFGGLWLGGSMDLAEGTETVSMSGKRNARPFVAGQADHRSVRDALLFPTWLTSLQPDYFLSYRIEPMSMESTRVVADVFVHIEARADNMQDVLLFWDETNAEDRAICERQHRGIAAPGFRPGAYSSSEDGVHAFERRVALWLLNELDEGAQ